MSTPLNKSISEKTVENESETVGKLEMRWEAHSSFSWNDPSWSRVAWLLTFFFPSFSASTHPLFFCSAPTSHLTSYFGPLFSIELFLLTTLPNSSSSLPFVQFFNHLQTSTNAGQRRSNALQWSQCATVSEKSFVADGTWTPNQKVWGSNHLPSGHTHPYCILCTKDIYT